MSRSSQNKTRAELITARLLKSWPLPGLEEGGDKEARGRVLIVAGSEGMPGAAILASMSALRAGAGKLQIAVPSSAAPWVAMAVPEALVIALPEGSAGISAGISAAKSAKLLRERIKAADAVLIGPGMQGGTALTQLLTLLLPALADKVLVLDAEALKAIPKLQKSFAKYRIQAVITPHAGEMASLTGKAKEQIQADPVSTALEFAAEACIVTALKGSETLIAGVDGALYSNRAGNVGLGISGSGDTLAGIIVGLAARGATAVQAAVWGVHLHACAGDVLAKKIGSVGYLPREIPLEIPALMDRFQK